MSDFSHLDQHGHAFMVDVTAKSQTLRRARSQCRVLGLERSARLLASDWGREVFAAARIAGLGAAKATSGFVPLCHPLPLTDLDVTFELGRRSVLVSAHTETVGQTGVEMEALTACAIAALSVLMAVRQLDPLASVEALALWHKSGGRSGTFERPGRLPDDEGAERP